MLAQYLSYEFIALFMFITMLLMMFTGQRVFGAIGFVAAASALLIWGEGSMEMPYTATWKLFKWYPMLTLPLFIYMGFMISESGIANDLYKMFHVLFGGMRGGLAIGTMFMMVAISAMNGLSVAGMAIGATIALPEMLKFLLRPGNILMSIKMLHENSDFIWSLSGDKSNDFSYYSKRGLLSMIYLATLIYWLNDKSEKDIATKNFISKSVDGIVDGVSRLKQLSILKNLAENFMSRYASKRTS